MARFETGALPDPATAGWGWYRATRPGELKPPVRLDADLGPTSQAVSRAGSGKNWSQRQEFDTAAGVWGRFFNSLALLKSGYENADKEDMSTGSINPLSSGYLQSILTSAIQGVGKTTSTTSNSLSGVGASSSSQSPDSTQLSPFAQMLSELQQLQQSDPTKYQQVTQQVATNLQSAAQTAQANGNTTAANQLNQLATDFTNASKSGQLPSIQDLAQAIGGGHHHHHHAHSASADSDGSSGTNTSSSSTSTSASQALSQLLAAYQANGGQTDPLNPMSIILNTLSSSGISGTNG